MRMALDEVRFNASTHIFGGEGRDHSGGGSGAGEFVFADLAELDGVITEWMTLRDEIRHDQYLFTQAVGFMVAPAQDDPSGEQAGAAKVSVEKARDHNKAMLDYADDYITRLTASRQAMAATEERNTARVTPRD
ncbi:hypothetical protein [Herbihabitans rhizosphaerae]|uniref:hypothetical protein n=1 Tax=Herbihabitans rhizosphaerae TaxID=1872711 RepID=UPI00102CA635|nr:hypothetical protein [Herbihabitans rhizosphaerae]